MTAGGLATAGGQTQFFGSASADHATITNAAALQIGSGVGTTIFNGSAATADHATITNLGTAVNFVGGITYFVNGATADHATIFVRAATTNSGGSAVAYFDNSSAGSATITADGAPHFAMGYIHFVNGSTAASATITTGGGLAAGGLGGLLTFDSNATAGQSVIHNQGALVNGASSGTTYFNGGASAGQSTIYLEAGVGNGGSAVFQNTSDGGTARAIIEGSGLNSGGLDISQITNATINIGSIEGGGIVSLGNKNLTVGGNNLSTTFSGLIRDGGFVNATGGSLTKTGTGTFTLTGDNTYTGSTVVADGVLIVRNPSGLALGSGTVAVLATPLSELRFVDDSSAGTNSFFQSGTTLIPSYGLLTFTDTSRAATATIQNIGTGVTGQYGGHTIFQGSANGDHAAITDDGSAFAGSGAAGETDFIANSHAGFATIDNIGGGIAGASGGKLFFEGFASAQAAAITNRAGWVANGAGGVTNFMDSALAGTAAIINSGGAFAGTTSGTTQFFGNSSADHSVIHNQGAQVNGANSGNTYFYSVSSAGNATLYADAGVGNGGGIIFVESSDGGTARVIIGGTGLDSGGLDMSLLTTAGMNLGSLEGSGITSLGSKKLSVGGNNLSTTYSGIIRDGGYSGASGGSLTKVGTGTLTLEGVNTYTGNTTVSAGTLKFNLNSGVATIAAGVTATVAAGATLELAGSVSALGTTSGNRVHVVNDSTAAGIVVSGTSQVVGNIDGSGNTQVNAGSDLTANHIIQNALVIGGAAGNPALVTIATSDADGNPLGLTSAQSNGGVLADLIRSDRLFLVGIVPVHFHDDIVSSEMGLIAPSLSKSNLAGTGAAVPEPSTIALLISAIAIVGLGGRCRRKLPIMKATSETRCGDPSRRSRRPRSH